MSRLLVVLGFRTARTDNALPEAAVDSQRDA